MIYVIGDSHALYTFSGIDGVKITHIGAITLKRLGDERDSSLIDAINKINFCSDDFLIISSGEIDMRCYVKPHIERGKDLDQLLLDWAFSYVKKISDFNLTVKTYIMSIIPPSSFDKANGSAIHGYPAAGTDKERALYTKKMNDLIKGLCGTKVFFLDTYSKYVDNEGMLAVEKSAGDVHVGNPSFAKELLIELKILEGK